MTQDEDKGFFDKLGQILNAPLPGTCLLYTSDAADDLQPV